MSSTWILTPTWIKISPFQSMRHPIFCISPTSVNNKNSFPPKTYKKGSRHIRKIIQERERHKEGATSIALDCEKVSKKEVLRRELCSYAISMLTPSRRSDLKRKKKRKPSLFWWVWRKKERSSTIFPTRLHQSTSDSLLQFILFYLYIFLNFL